MTGSPAELDWRPPPQTPPSAPRGQGGPYGLFLLRVTVALTGTCLANEVALAWPGSAKSGFYSVSPSSQQETEVCMSSHRALSSMRFRNIVVPIREIYSGLYVHVHCPREIGCVVLRSQKGFEVSRNAFS